MEKFIHELKKEFTKIKTIVNNPDEIYLISEENVFKLVEALKNKKFNLISMFAADNFDNSRGIDLFYVFDNEEYKEILIVKTHAKTSNISIFSLFPTAYLYEREIKDGFGVIFDSTCDTRRLFLHEIYPEKFHPLLKSFKNSKIPVKKKISESEEYVFREVKGEGIYQIPVGPVHAGIIAPGHFRFSVIGETIFNLEIRHFWKHRGVEKLSEGKTPEEGLLISESICGDESVANSLAYCNAIEKICKIRVPQRAVHLRVLFAEMERIYSLLGDLSGMIVDIAYPAGSSPFFIFREEIMRWNEAISKSRFYKGSLKIGGVSSDVSPIVLKELSDYLHKFTKEFTTNVNTILNSYFVSDRFETTGIVKKELIGPMNLSGPLARASGINNDVRVKHPYALYEKIVPSDRVMDKGDVLARFLIKADTIKDSARIIKEVINSIPSGNISSDYKITDGYSFSIVESSRGQNLHFVVIKNKKIDRYKIRTASFCNWYAIEPAVIGNIVPDFPLINKSMNLSYEGNDL
ncbi:Membrane-bound hydrogenase subunit alpha [uncultured archaeon]|nr:Membrane-bound hydrogenase subunit alpha [uncultured archaeon]